jgi:thioredoxin reductase
MLEVAIIGAGPYGLSIAAYFRRASIPFRIFGRPMDSWRAHMPKGMFLKSDGFASNIYDPRGEFTLRQFCNEQGIKYRDTENPVRLDIFSAYGLAFKDRMVPELEDKLVVDLTRLQDGFRLRLDDGEVVNTRRVVLAVGITHFERVPSELAHLPPEYLSHSSRHHDLESFRGRNIVVIGGGASATDLAGLLHDAGAVVQLVARQTRLRFHTVPSGKPRTLWQRIRHPKSGLGPGLRSYFFSNAPMLFRYLPERLRVELVRRSLGPSGGWFSKGKVIGRVPTLLGHQLESAGIQQGIVRLQLRTIDGDKREILADHVIAATGYKVDLGRLHFLSAEIRAKLKAVDATPVLSSTFESSVPGLFFVGVAAANSFGPLMRFAFGAEFAARRLTRTLVKSLSRVPAAVTAASSVITKNEQTRAI